MKYKQPKHIPLSEAPDQEQTQVRSHNAHEVEEYTARDFLGSEDQIAPMDLYRRLSILSSMTEVAQGLLSHVKNIFAQTQASALYIWNDDEHSLKCYAAINYIDKDRLGIDKELFVGLARRPRPVLLQSQASGAGPATFSRLVVPMVRDDEVMGFVYLRIKADPTTLNPNLTARVFDVMRICAPLLSHLLLRKKMDTWLNGMIETLLATIAAKDTYTIGHSERVCRFSVLLGQQLGLDPKALNNLMFSAMIHDIGKVGIPDHILKKAGLLSNEEFEHMRQHPSIGADIVSHMPMAEEIMGGIKHHHERWDGTGYPDGLIGGEIPLFGRIVAVTDAFDAMTSGRSYSGYMSVDDAISKLAVMEDLFDPEILRSFVSLYESGGLSIRTGTIFKGRAGLKFDFDPEIKDAG